MAFGDTVQTKGGSASDASSPWTVTLTFDATATSGNLLVLVGSWDVVGTGYNTPAGGWTAGPTIPVGTGNFNAATFWKISDGTETSVIASLTGSGSSTVGAAFAEFEGPFAASPLDQSAESEANIATAVTSQTSGTTGTTAQADELLLALFACDRIAFIEDGRAYTNSFTEAAISQTGVNRAGGIIAKRVVAATGTYESTFSTTDTGDEMYGAIATFKKASGGSPQTVNPLRQIVTVAAITASLLAGGVSRAAAAPVLAFTAPTVSRVATISRSVQAPNLPITSRTVTRVPGVSTRSVTTITVPLIAPSVTRTATVTRSLATVTVPFTAPAVTRTSGLTKTTATIVVPITAPPVTRVAGTVTRSGQANTLAITAPTVTRQTVVSRAAATVTVPITAPSATRSLSLSRTVTAQTVTFTAPATDVTTTVTRTVSTVTLALSVPAVDTGAPELPDNVIVATADTGVATRSITSRDVVRGLTPRSSRRTVEFTG
jgi:hypothetical protein